ncbi:MAG: response regulator [Deltaproteobacteria bacterium]|nr:response regulator [Deltaproteobacteria bacterium]
MTEKTLHPLLRRQLRKASLETNASPTTVTSWQGFLRRISHAYVENDQDRYTVERSLSISSREMQEQIERSRVAEENLRAATDRVVALIENLPGGNMIEDENRKIFKANREFCKMFGIHCPPEKLVGADCLTTVEKAKAYFENPENFVKRIEETISAKKVVIGDEITLRDKRILERNYFPIFINNTYHGHFWQYADVTEHRHQRMELERAERMAAVGALAAGVAHEINNPLTYVLANLMFLSDELGHAPMSSELTRMLAEAREGAERVRDIVRDLRTFSHMPDEQVDAIDVRDSLEWAIKMANNEIRHRAQIVKQYGEPPRVLGNQSKLAQVFLNLLINAAHAIPVGHSSTQKIRIATKTDERSCAVIAIQDSGEGIPKKNLRRIFEPFFTTKPIGIGTGLGLSICLNIVRAMGGDITVKSEKGHGTEVTVVIPPARAQDAAGATQRQPLPTIPEAKRHGRLLIIDDEKMLASVFTRAIGVDHDVTFADSSNDAIALLEKDNRFDLILSDLMMPNITGMELYGIVSARWPELSARMIFMTGGAFTEQAREFVAQLPPERILDKPFGSRTLKTIINARLNAGNMDH